MQPTDLAFHTTAELVGELMRRNTFMGIIVHSEQEHRGQAWQGERVFKVHLSRSLEREQAGRLLDVIAERIGGGSDAPGL